MKKIISFLLASSIFILQITTAYADSSLSEKGVNSDKEVISPISRSIEIPKKEPLKEDSKKNIMPNEIAIKIPNDVELEEFQDDFEGDYRPSKWEMAKNVAVYLGKSFVNDVKSYVKFYPLHQIAQAISFCLWYFPAYALYKKTGIDIPAKLSSYITSENKAIFAHNLYNVIPMTLTSFLYKWGRDAYAYMKR